MQWGNWSSYQQTQFSIHSQMVQYMEIHMCGAPSTDKMFFFGVDALTIETALQVVYTV